MKNFQKLYSTPNDSLALEQRFFIKEEVTRGTMVAPAGTDFIRALSGGGANKVTPNESSPVRSGRHHTTPIQMKSATSWSMPAFFMINRSLGAFATTEIDPAMRVLMKSLLGAETVGGSSLKYDASSDPETTFTLLVNGGQFGFQAAGAFVESGNLQFPGDGQSTAEFAGAAKTMYRCGIAKSTTNNNAGNTFTALSDEGGRFEVGGFVMIIESDGTTRSADTPTGSPRTITAINGDVITVSGAVLADADGSATPVYLCYYEPTSPTAINDPLTGLVGEITFAGLTQNCVRSFGVNIVNNHELHDFCWGETGLSGPLFTPGGRMTAEVTAELSMNHELLEWINGLDSLVGEDITLQLGSASGRRMEIVLPKVIFPVPEITVPDEGSIPVSFTGVAYQTAEDAADEVQVFFK